MVACAHFPNNFMPALAQAVTVGRSAFCFVLVFVPREVLSQAPVSKAAESQSDSQSPITQVLE